jgi:hypothetical protein
MNVISPFFLFFFIFKISTQRNGEGEFELTTSALLCVVHNRLNYPLEML